MQHPVMYLADLAAISLLVFLALKWLDMGTRAGDRASDTRGDEIEADSGGRGVWLTIEAAGPEPVLIGARLRPRSLRLRCEGRAYVSSPRRTTRRLAPSDYPVLAALEPREPVTLLVPAGDDLPRRAELVLAIGECDRLRLVHHAVELAGRSQPGGGSADWPYRRAPTP